MKERIKILILDDEGYDNKYLKARRFLRENSIQYDIALTLEEGIILLKKKNYDAIILDRNFPEKEGEKSNIKSPEKFLMFLKETKKQIPVIVYSVCRENLDESYVKKYMITWNPYTFLNFLETNTKWRMQ